MMKKSALYLFHEDDVSYNCGPFQMVSFQSNRAEVMTRQTPMMIFFYLKDKKQVVKEAKKKCCTHCNSCVSMTT